MGHLRVSYYLYLHVSITWKKLKLKFNLYFIKLNLINLDFIRLNLIYITIYKFFVILTSFYFKK